ncbi:hypothetical protein OAD66_02730 [Bacteroidia bacterium]|nr:hypothetical protein [Bacteroidia bacterium]MDB9882028.1 hypothetical protein [Bacteroidia bacterium]
MGDGFGGILWYQPFNIAAGCYSAYAVCGDENQLYAAGRNYHGELGQDPSVVDARTPMKISTLKDIVDIKATAFGFAALDKLGDVYGWGKWVEGQPVYIPQKLPGLSNIVSISGKNDGWHFMAISNSGNCYVWGRNQYAQLGIGDASPFKFDPLLVATDVVEICAGETFSYLIKSDGKMYGTGRGKQGSIWMNLPNVTRFSFTEINNEVAPMYMCKNKRRISLIVNRVICEGESVSYGGKTFDQTVRYFNRIKGTNVHTLLVLKATITLVR